MKVISTPSLLQVTVVAGPPVEMQVSVFDDPLKVRLVTIGEPVLLRYNELAYESNASMVIHSLN